METLKIIKVSKRVRLTSKGTIENLNEEKPSEVFMADINAQDIVKHTKDIKEYNETQLDLLSMQEPGDYFIEEHRLVKG